jgi:hypothetical protein
MARADLVALAPARSAVRAAGCMRGSGASRHGTYPAMKHAIIALLLLCGCATEDVAAEAPQTSELATTDDEIEALQTSELATTDDEIEALGVSTAAGVCPSGSDQVCKPSGACLCCWPFWELCCPPAKPYIRCNFSGDCRCSDIA